jgi:TRAP-type C4-dicarboxylate transport system substrate-binding protein
MSARVETLLKIATLAPYYSSWWTLFQQWGNNLEEHTGGKTRLKIYGGSLGTRPPAQDDRDAVRLMRMGQRSGAALTSVGLGLIWSDVRVLQLPMMFATYDELDYVRHQLDADMRKKFEEKGYVLLAWGDVGPVHIFSNTPIRSKADLAHLKLWGWVDDSVLRVLFDDLGVHPVALGMTDVMPCLQNGLVNAVYGSPLSTLAQQWYPIVKYMTSIQVRLATGAIVILKKVFDALDPETQKILLADSKELEAKLLTTIGADNDKALVTMQQAGLQVVESPPEMFTQFEAAALALRPKLEPSLYSHEWRMRVEKLLADYRAGKK